ncbi:MAG: polyphosphate polymerase domain-containing protein [Gammaproteobacteria bacterium]
MTSDWLTAPFAPVSLEALNAKAAMLERRDHKYVVRADALRALVRDLAPGFDVLEIDGRRSFTYETCYFDDPELRSYHDHHQGRRQRMKVRVRRYADTAQCFVEVKLKDRRGVTVKRRMPYAPEKFGTLDAQALDHVRRCHEAMYGRPFERALAPVLRMSYRRTTLVARAGGERTTIDSAIRFHGRDAGRAPDDDLFIVETKSARGHGLADAVLRRHHQHPTTGCSKYCVGLGAIGAVDRFNRFRTALRRLGVLPSAA